MRHTQINPAKIDIDDSFYIFTQERQSKILEQSISVVGMLHPVVLEELSDQRYRIVSGSRRVNSALEIGLTEIPVLVYAENEKSRFQLFLINLYENLAIRTLNTMEISRILIKLTFDFQLSKSEIIETYLPLLGLGKNPKVIDTYLRFNKLEEALKQAVSADFFGIEMALKLLDFSREDRMCFFKLASKLKLGKNRQREMLNLLTDISKRDDRSFPQIIEIESIQKAISDDSIPTPLQAEQIRNILRTRRYPRFSEVEQKFTDLLKKMKLPPAISLTPFPYFEQSKYTLTVEFKDHADFKEKVDFLRRLSGSESIRELGEI